MPFGVKILFYDIDSMDEWLKIHKKYFITGCSRSRGIVKIEISDEDPKGVLQNLKNPSYQKNWKISGWDSWKIKKKKE